MRKSKKRIKKLSKEKRDFIINQEKQRIIRVLTEIVNDPVFSAIRLAPLAKKILTHHQVIIKLFDSQKIQLTLASKLDKNLIEQLITMLNEQPIPLQPIFIRKPVIPRATFVRG